MKGLFNHHALQTALLALGLLATAGLTGCQVQTGGQTLPSPYYLDDDVQYFPSGRAFKCQREADAIKAINDGQTQQQQQAAARQQ